MLSVFPFLCIRVRWTETEAIEWWWVREDHRGESKRERNVRCSLLSSPFFFYYYNLFSHRSALYIIFLPSSKATVYSKWQKTKTLFTKKKDASSGITYLQYTQVHRLVRCIRQNEKKKFIKKTRDSSFTRHCVFRNFSKRFFISCIWMEIFQIFFLRRNLRFHFRLHSKSSTTVNQLGTFDEVIDLRHRWIGVFLMHYFCLFLF